MSTMNKTATASMRLAAAAAAILIGAAACGGGDGDGPGSAGTATSGHHGGSASPGGSSGAPRQTGHNAADVMFAQMMIPHHRQAVQMSKVVAKGSENPEVKRLAAQIERAQAPEIATMTGWLREWGVTAPPEHGGEMPGMDHGGGMPGMMSDAQMKEFAALKGDALDRRFLTMMTEHHEGAVTMARTESAKGASPEARRLAETIIKTQQAEITAMRGLLRK